MLRVKDGLVRHGDKSYKIGEVLPVLSESDEDRLIYLGVAERFQVEVPNQEEKPEGTKNKESTEDTGGKEENAEGEESEGEEHGNPLNFTLNPEEYVNKEETTDGKRNSKQ